MCLDAFEGRPQPTRDAQALCRLRSVLRRARHGQAFEGDLRIVAIGFVSFPIARTETAWIPEPVL